MNVELKQIAESKVRQLGGTVHGVLVKNEAGAWVAVSDAGRVMWLDGFEGQAGRAQDGGSGGEIAALQKVTYEDGVADLVHMDGRQLVDFRDGTLFYTHPQPADNWKPANNMSGDLPQIGKPVMGYHPDWVDEDFCADGIRECFLFGDGSEWQSARWDGYSDQWIVEDGAPDLWHPHPNPPAEGAE